MRCTLLVAVAILAAGCMPTGQAEAEPGRAPGMALPGPVLVAEIVNRTESDLVFSYEFETADRSTAGSGEGFVSACTATTESWSEISGNYSLMIDGEVVHEGRIAPGQGDGGFLFVRVQIRPGGEPELHAPVLRAQAPPLGSRQLAGCA